MDQPRTLPQFKTPFLEANLLLAVMAGKPALASELMALLPKDARVILAAALGGLCDEIESIPPTPASILAITPAPAGLTQFCEPNALLAALLGDWDACRSTIAYLPPQNRAWLLQASSSLASLCAQP